MLLKPYHIKRPRPGDLSRILSLMTAFAVSAATFVPGLPTAFAAPSTAASATAPHAPISEETLDALEALGEQEAALLTSLFETATRIEQMEAQRRDLQDELNALQLQMAAKQNDIKVQMKAYEQVKSTLGEVLKSRQRAGAASSLDIVLSSSSLKDLLRRLNLLRDLSRRTEALMANAETERQRLESENAMLAALRDEKQIRENDLAAALTRIQQEQASLETRLNALDSDRAYYEAMLNRLDQSWTAFKPKFTSTVTALSDLLKTGSLPPDTMEIEFSLIQARGTLTDDKFNTAVQLQTLPLEIHFDFSQKGAVMGFEQEAAELSGHFEITGPRMLSFKLESGTFHGVRMSKDALEDLVARGTLTFDLSDTLGNSTLRQIRHLDGAVELLIDVKLF